VLLYDTKTLALRATLDKKRKQDNSFLYYERVYLTPDGSLLVGQPAGGGQPIPELWTVGATDTRPFEGKVWARAMSLSPDGKTLAVARYTEPIVFIDPATGREKALEVAEKRDTPVVATEEQKRKALDEIKRLGGVIIVGPEVPPHWTNIDLGKVKEINTVLPRLREHLKVVPDLNLRVVEVKDSGLAQLKDLTNLVGLTIEKSPISNAGLANLAGLNRLQDLGIFECKSISDDGMVHIKGLTTLTSLTISYSPITLAGIAHLKGLPNLETLDLGGLGLTDAWLVHLKELPKLKELRRTEPGRREMERLTDKGREAFNKERPGVKIIDYTPITSTP
jgi:hypothetical protein